MSRSESKLSDGLRARSYSWVMTAMLVGLAGCTAPSPRPAPQGDTDTGTARKRLKDTRYQCPDGGTPMPSYALDAQPDGGVTAPDGCVIPGGAVAFDSDCAQGPVSFIASGRDVFADDGGSCTPSNGGSVTGGGDRYVVTVFSPEATCQLRISPDLPKDVGGSIDWYVSSSCSKSVTPITGTVEIATTDPDHCVGPDCHDTARPR